jgi:hypothetical protein
LLVQDLPGGDTASYRWIARVIRVIACPWKHGVPNRAAAGRDRADAEPGSQSAWAHRIVELVWFLAIA